MFMGNLERAESGYLNLSWTRIILIVTEFALGKIDKGVCVEIRFYNHRSRFGRGDTGDTSF